LCPFSRADLLRLWAMAPANEDADAVCNIQLWVAPENPGFRLEFPWGVVESRRNCLPSPETRREISHVIIT
jgi:hypothetical protein